MCVCVCVSWLSDESIHILDGEDAVSLPTYLPTSTIACSVVRMRGQWRAQVSGASTVSY